MRRGAPAHHTGRATGREGPSDSNTGPRFSGDFRCASSLPRGRCERSNTPASDGRTSSNGSPTPVGPSVGGYSNTDKSPGQVVATPFWALVDNGLLGAPARP